MKEKEGFQVQLAFPLELQIQQMMTVSHLSHVGPMRYCLFVWHQPISETAKLWGVCFLIYGNSWLS